MTSCTSHATLSLSCATLAASLVSLVETWLIEGGGSRISMIVSSRMARSCTDVSTWVDTRTILTMLGKHCRKTSLRNVKVASSGWIGLGVALYYGEVGRVSCR